ncbi:hypothetical protein OS493_002024 [Desmophyllum pertusum]|uniref:Uncharacterized protein n=1 Tax=Desmophyllum pertusum TaxID=174260 RepID=A0A9W9Z598_9CNID|nr:hypothetical protein OS493_002024 [Desmophyllum pertusum]
MEWCNYMKPVTPMQDLAKCICTSPFGTLSLTTYEQDQMKMKYRCKYDQYDKLCLAWEADRKKAVRERRTRTFPKNMETWSNSREAGELVPTFEDEITKYIQTYVWVRINWFSDEQKDSETGLWWASDKSDKQSLIHLDDLSVPLITAIEEGNVWFLTF